MATKPRTLVYSQNAEARHDAPVDAGDELPLSRARRALNVKLVVLDIDNPRVVGIVAAGVTGFGLVLVVRLGCRGRLASSCDAQLKLGKAAFQSRGESGGRMRHFPTHGGLG